MQGLLTVEELTTNTAEQARIKKMTELFFPAMTSHSTVQHTDTSDRREPLPDKPADL
jgi:hypothetical protein